MRHRKAGYKLGRTAAHRRATLRNLAAGVFEHGQITTTVQRAKAVQPMVEKIVTLAKRGDVHARRLVAAKLGRDRKGFDWLYLPKDATEEEREQVNQKAEFVRQFFEIPDADTVERNRYGELRRAPKLVKHIFENVAPRFADRDGGYTRIVRLGVRRKGDAGELCVLQFVGAEEGPEIGGATSQRRRKADRRTAFYERVSSGWGGGPAASASASASAETEEEPAATATAERPDAAAEAEAAAKAEDTAQTDDQQTGDAGEDTDKG